MGASNEALMVGERQLCWRLLTEPLTRPKVSFTKLSA